MRIYGLLFIGMVSCVGCDNAMGPPTNSNTPSTSNPADVVPPADVARPADFAPPADVVRPADEASPPDNTAINERDQNPDKKTPFDQGNNTSDINITADIRQKITGRSGMSINARNVKIITEEGMVTLRGPVNSQEEKDVIDAFAKESAGADKVDNQLEIAPDADK